MPFSLASIVQQKTGSFSAASGTVDLDTATTADNHIVICAMSTTDGPAIPGNNSVLGLPTGGGTWAWVSTDLFGIAQTQFTSPSVFIKPTAGGETSWTLPFAAGGPDQVCWAVFEITGVSQDQPVHLFDPTPNPFDDTATVTTRSTGSSDATSSYDVLALTVHAVRGTTSTIPTWSGHTNGFTELAQVGRTDGTKGIAMSVAAKPTGALAQHECTASLDAAGNTRAIVVVFDGEGSRHAVTADVFTGFEFGSVTTLTTSTTVSGNEACKVFDEVVGTPAMNTTTPRTGTYCLELSSSAAAECVSWTNTGTSPSAGVLSEWGPFGGNGVPSEWCGPIVGRLNVYFPTSLPAADTELATIEVDGSIKCTIRYVNASQKIGVQIGSGTQEVSDATVSADTWIGIDFRYSAKANPHTCDWQVTYTNGGTAVDQTQATEAVAAGVRIGKFRLGWSVARTATVRYDDVMLSKAGKNYPIGPVNVRLLPVDPAGTPSVSGSTANFGVMTANGTVAAWNATNARNAVDEVPPVVGASSDGAVQTAVAASEYMIFPMDTYTAAPLEVLRGLRFYFTGWAASATTALGPEIRVFDGTTAHQALVPGDHNWDNSTTILYWVTRMMRNGATPNSHYLLTQARLDAMEVRVGFATDATPDVGVTSIFAELATQDATVIEIMNIEDGAFTVDLRMDTVSSGTCSWLVTTPPGTRGATLDWVVSGVGGSHYVAANSTYEKVVGAVSVDEATNLTLTPDPA